MKKFILILFGSACNLFAFARDAGSPGPNSTSFFNLPLKVPSTFPVLYFGVDAERALGIGEWGNGEHERSVLLLHCINEA